MLLTYDEYKELGGGLDSTAFMLYGYEAEKRIEAQTYGRIKEATEPVKRCIVRLTDIMSQADIKSDKVTSWSNDGVSQSIKTVSANEYEQKISSIIHDFLINEVDDNGVPLLYLGVSGID